MEWLEPVETTCNVKYSSSVVNTSGEDSLRLIHGSFPDANIAWFANGDQLDVVSTKHGGVQSRHFHCQQGQEFEVTCVAPITDEPLVLVGLSSNTGSGAVALYNYSTSLILNSWSISHKVTCICSMEMPNTNYKKILKSDCYLFAVGTEEGHVMLLAVDQHFKFCEGTHLLELNIVHYVTTDDIMHKRAFFKPPVVLVIPLNDPMYRAGRFVLESMHESHEVLSKPQEEVCVTALRYIPQNQSLCVGYNTQGAFQLFSLKTLDLDFSGFAQGCNGEQLDQILDFAFLEPEDDPRHFCYLMVVAQTSPSSGLIAAPFAVLYSLTYVNKDASSEGVIIYENLQYITLRLDLNFGPLIIPKDTDIAYGNATLLTCKSLASSSNNNCTRATACYGLCYFAIQWSDGVYVGIFDLNQWYQAQMPSRWIFDDMSHLCPFMGFYRSQVGSKKMVYQTWIQPDTMSIFHRSATTPMEAFFYPSALSFRLIMTSPSETQSFLFLGIQSLLLQNLAESGSLVLNQPHRFYIKAMKAGLAASEVTAPNAIQMAESLLNIGLENNSRSFLISCIKDEGANLNFVEKWAWQQVVNLKALRENLCQMLFDHSAQEMEPQMHNQLYHVTHQFSNLSVLYDVMDKRIRSLNSGVNDKLRDKSRAIALLSLHLETVLWFLHGGLLPEADDDQEESSSLPYPRRQLEEFYRTRRSDIEALNASVRAGEVLLIEQLVPSSVADLWAEERGSNDLIYPPPSLYALLSAYLRPDVDDVTKHRLVQYVFMDLTWIYSRHPHFGNILQHLMTFPSTYSLKPSTIKVTQAFWHLDHRNFDDALGMLLDPLVHAGDISNTQQRAILRSFLYQDQRRHALKYATLRHPVCPELEDIQLHLTILIANSLIGDALSYIRRNKNQRNSQELMDHLLCGCQEMRKFSVLLTLPLSDEEEEHVANYLKQSRNIDLQEALLLFYIQRCKYPDAIAYSQRLNQMWPARDAVSRERYNRREMLMQTLISALPPITCKLATVANSKPASNYGGVNFPQPLSVSVRPAMTKVQYSGSNFFRTVIEQSRATWLIEQKLHEEAQTPLKSRKRKLDVPEEQPTMETENTPFLCNIVQPNKRNVTLGMSLVFPSPKVTAGPESSMMDITQFNETAKVDESQPKQGKRPRYSLFPKAVVALKTDKDVVAVLQTPPIQRSRPMFQGSANADGSSSNRPSSILKDKMRRFMDFSTFEPSPSSRPMSRNGDGGDTIISDSEAMEVSMVDSSTAKHLRFSLPNVKSSPSNSESSQSRLENDVEGEMHHVTSPKSPPGNVSVAAEEFLSFIEDSEPSNSVPQVSASPLTRSPLRPLLVNVVPLVEQSVVETADMSDDRMEITNMTTFHIPQEIQPSLPDDIFEEEPNEPKPTMVPDQGLPTNDKEDSGSEIICLNSSGSEEEEEEIVEEEESEHSSLGDEDAESENLNRKELESSVEEEGEEEEEQDSKKSNSSDEDVEALYQPGPSITVRQRFAPSSSSSSSYSNDGNSSNDGLDFSLRAKMEKSVVRGYSQVEPDLVSDHQAEESDQIAQPVEEVKNLQEEEDEGEKEPNYSQVEEDLELNEEDEPDSLDAVERVEVRGHLIAVTDSSPVDDFDLSNEEEEELEDEEEIQEDVEDFELKLSDTPGSTIHVATRRSSVRRSRFRMSIAASPGQEEEVDDDEEREVRGPELSHYDMGEEEESSAEEDEQPEVTRRVSSHQTSHKSKLQFSDSESSSAEGEDSDIEEVAQEPVGDQSAAMESADVSVEEDNVQSSKPASSKTRLELTDSETSGTEEEQDEKPEEEVMGAEGDPLSTSSQDDDDALKQRKSVSQSVAHPTKEEASILSEGSRTEDDRGTDGQLCLGGESSDIEEVAQESAGDQSVAMGSADVSVDEDNVQPSKPASSKARLELTDSESSEEEEDEQSEEADVGSEEDPLSTSNQEDGAVKQRESVSPSLVHPTKEETSVLSEGSLTEDNQDFKERLLRHEVVPVPLLPDASVIPAGGHNLSVIAEERTFEQSIAIERSEFSSLEEEEEIEEEIKDHCCIPEVPVVIAVAVEEEVTEVTNERPSSSDFLVDTMDAAIVDEDAFEVDEPADKNDAAEVDEPAEKDKEASEIEEPAEKDEEIEEMEPVGPRRRGRPRSVKLSRVPLPFSSRRTTWDPSIVSEFRKGRAQSTSPTKEIPPHIAGPSDDNQDEEKPKASGKDVEQEEQVEEPVVPRKRGRPKSVKLSQVPLSFSSQPSTSDPSAQQNATPEPSPNVEEAPKITTPRPRGRPRRLSTTSTEQAGPAASPSIAPTRRSNRIAVSSGTEEDDLGTPTLQLTPPKAIPKRRSRAAVEDETSVPPSVEVSPTGSNVSGMGSAPGTPMRRSIRLALRDKTPEPTGSASIGEALLASLSRIRRHSASGPTPGDVTPRRRSGRISANASRDNSPNSITSEPPPRTETTPGRKTKPKARGLRSAVKSATLNLFPVEEEEAEAKTEVKEQQKQETDMDESFSSQEEELAQDGPKSKKGGRGSRPSSVTSSPSSTRYNLRRTRRASELDIISEEDGARQQQSAEASDASVASTLKRRRHDPTEENSDQPGPSGSQEEVGSQEEEEPTKRTVRNKRRKKVEEAGPSEELHFAPTARPPPKSLPKRDSVVNKSRSSRGRRSLLLPEK